MRLIFIGFGGNCGGTILDSTTILTAAHCLPSKENIEQFPGLLKLYNVEAGVTISKIGSQEGQRVPVESFTVHPNFRMCK